MREDEFYDGVGKASVGLLIIGLLAGVMSLVWKPLGFEQPTWNEEQQAEFTTAAMDYHKLGHRIDPPADSQENAEYQQKLKIAKAAYEVQKGKLDDARNRGDFTVAALFWGGVTAMAAGIIGVAFSRGSK